MTYLPILVGNLPAFGPVTQPSPLESLIVILIIPVLIATFFIIAGMGKTWTSKDEQGKDITRYSK